MGVRGREGFDLRTDIRSKDYKRIFSWKRWRYNWKYTLSDTFSVLYRLIRCRIFGHDYKSDYFSVDLSYYSCRKCYTRISEEKYLSNKREKSINELLN